MDLSSRLRAIVKSGPPKPGAAGLSEREVEARRGPAPSERDTRASRGELTYEPDTGGYESAMDLSQVGAILGGQPVDTPFGRCLVIDRRYEADRWHGSIQIGQCEVDDLRVAP